MIHIRRAGPMDTRAMADLLNAIIQRGGTTAMVEPVTSATLTDWMASGGAHAAWHIAEDDGGNLMGVQWIEPHHLLPPEACDVATYVRLGRDRLGIGARLFEATRAAAVALGYDWINATIRADNSGGLAYYQSRGFETWARDDNVRLGNGQIVSKMSKRYTLT
jgi:L-amino acid N-acyltransferase YncA